MTILLLNKNLLWTVRLRRALTAEGHTVISQTSPHSIPDADVAIINLYDHLHELEDLVPKLKKQSTLILAYAGHKDKELWEQAIRAGCHRVVSYGEIANRPNAILKDLTQNLKPTPSEVPL